MALPSEPVKPSRCPSCGAAMEAGFVLGTTNDAGGFYLGQFPLTIGWITGPATGRGASDQIRSERLAPVGMTVFRRDPRFPASRCTACRLVVFRYDAPVYDPKAPAAGVE